MIERSLPPLQAEAVILRSVVGLDVPEVARIMDKRPAPSVCSPTADSVSSQQLFSRTADVEHR